NGHAFRSIAYGDLINLARWIECQIDDSHRVHLAVSYPRCAIVADQPELAVRCDLDIVRKQTGEHVISLVGHRRSVDIKKRHLVCRSLSHERALAVGRNGDRGDLATSASLLSGVIARLVGGPI